MLKRDNSDDEVVYETGSPGLLPGLEMHNNLPNMQGLVQGLVPLPGMGPPMGAHVGLQMQAHHRPANQLPLTGGMVGVAHNGLPAGAALLPHATTPAGAVLTLNLTPAANDEQPKIKKIKPNDAQPMVPRQKRGRKKKEEPQEETVSLAAGVSSRGRERKPRSFAFADEQSQYAYSLNASNSQRYQRRIKGESYDDGEVIYFKSDEEATAAEATAGGGGEGRTAGSGVEGSIGAQTDQRGGDAATNGPSGPAPYSSGGVGVLAAAGAGAVGGAGVDYRSAGRGQTRSFGDEEDDDDDDEDDEEDS